MKRRVFELLLAGFLVSMAASAASAGAPMAYYALELQGGSRLFSLDPPVRKGKVLLFHSYPDGTYMSLPASEVERVSKLEAEPEPQDKLAPGATVYVGNPVEGPSYEAPPQASPPQYAYSDPGYGYGYTGYYWGGYVPGPRPPQPPPHAPASRIGPNGFPILAPPGSPGSAPPPIGSNGFPIISAPPLVAAPRQR